MDTPELTAKLVMLGWKKVTSTFYFQGSDCITICSNHIILKKNGKGSYHVNTEAVLNRVIRDD